MNTYVYGKECVSDVIGILTRSALFFSIALFFYCNKKQIKARLRENAPFLEQQLDVQMKCLSPFRSSYSFPSCSSPVVALCRRSQMRSSFYDKISFTEREREREKSTPVQGLGYKRKKEGEKNVPFQHFVLGRNDYEYNTRR